MQKILSPAANLPNLYTARTPVRCTINYYIIPSQRMDMERATREAMDPNLRHKPRLLSDEELPSWLIRDEDEVRIIRVHAHMVVYCSVKIMSLVC